ncbi:hypothetical protein C8R47DRAFT_1294029 [Mycena vitilis]|nr:hypothetical protein C8R47DRAFT_1294029 [Mycena vitilis]
MPPARCPSCPMHTRSSPAFGAVKLTGREAFPVILGFNAAGTVAEVGSGVSTLTVGDRDAISWPNSVHPTGHRFYLALDAAATIPDNFITAFYTIFDQLALPIPTSFLAATPPPIHETPILVYGAGATAGQYAVQLLRAAGYNNISATASPAHHEYLRSLGATHVFDYRSPTLAAEVAKAGTLARIAEVLRPTGTVAVLLPIKQGDKVAVGDAPISKPVRAGDDVQIRADILVWSGASSKWCHSFSYIHKCHFQNEFLRDNLMPRILPELLEQGLIKPNRVRLLDQGTFKERVAEGLDLLRNNSVSGEKIIVKVP